MDSLTIFFFFFLMNCVQRKKQLEDGKSMNIIDLWRPLRLMAQQVHTNRSAPAHAEGVDSLLWLWVSAFE